jgi:hypothetical protein
MKYGKFFIMFALVMIMFLLAISQILLADNKPCCDPNMKMDPNCAACKDMITLKGMFVCPHYLMMKEGNKMPCMSMDPNMKMDPDMMQDPNMKMDPDMSMDPNMKMDPDMMQDPNMKMDPNMKHKPNMKMIKECIVKDTKAGEPLLFVDEKGNVYVTLICMMCKNNTITRNKLSEMGMEPVTIKAMKLEKGGLNALVICAVEKTEKPK